MITCRSYASKERRHLSIYKTTPELKILIHFVSWGQESILLIYHKQSLKVFIVSFFTRGPRRNKVIDLIKNFYAKVPYKQETNTFCPTSSSDFREFLVQSLVFLNLINKYYDRRKRKLPSSGSPKQMINSCGFCLHTISDIPFSPLTPQPSWLPLT